MTVICQPTLDTNGPKVAFGAITGSYVTALTVTGSCRKLFMFNTTDQSVWVTLNGGTTDFLLVPSNGSFALDWDGSMHYNGTVQIKHDGVAPLSGYVSLGIVKGV